MTAAGGAVRAWRTAYAAELRAARRAFRQGLKRRLPPRDLNALARISARRVAVTLARGAPC